MTNWPPPDGPPPAWGQPYPVAPSYGAPLPSSPYGPPPSRPTTTLPWFRTTTFLVLGGLGLLLLGGAAGALVTFVGTRAADRVGNAFDDITTEVTTYGPGGDLATFALGPGQCATEDVYEASGYAEGSGVACEARHAVEHYASAEAPELFGDGSTFDRSDLDDFADSACYLAFEPFVGLAYADSDFDYATLVPSEAAWDAGARTVHCLLYDVDGGSTTGTANASGR